MYGITVGEAMKMAVLSNGGGNTLELDYQNRYAGLCVKNNYIEEQMVTCYYKSVNSVTGNSRSNHALTAIMIQAP